MFSQKKLAAFDMVRHPGLQGAEEAAGAS